MLRRALPDAAAEQVPHYSAAPASRDQLRDSGCCVVGLRLRSRFAVKVSDFPLTILTSSSTIIPFSVAGPSRSPAGSYACRTSEMSTIINNLAASPESSASSLEKAAQANGAAATKADPRRHILFIIDELCEIGGAERVLFKMIEMLPAEKFRSSLLTFRIDDEVDFRQIHCPVHVMP